MLVARGGLASAAVTSPALLLVVLLLAAACGSGGDGSPTPTGITSGTAETTRGTPTSGDAPPAGTTRPQARPIPVALLQPGDCFSLLAPLAQVREALVVDCVEPHDAELFFTARIEGDRYPGENAVATFAQQQCLGAFEAYVGVPYDDSAVYADFFPLTAATWATGDHEVRCVLFFPESGPITGSLRGARR
ncbi:MAG: septum formation family protein [Dehalococcoidia bacterium]|jgi:hypothetical protein|nr:septum formation family protein [Dehalococcoidia bacterium]